MTQRKLKFGIELEVATTKSRREIVQALVDNGIDAIEDSYGSAVRESLWKVQYDGSLNNGWEIISPPLTDTIELEKVVHVLRKVLKVRCNKKTGLHIHHDINDFTVPQIKKLYDLYNKYEESAIKSILAKTRINNTYCQPVSQMIHQLENVETLEDFKRTGGTRYMTLNSKSYVKFGTIEFRHHQGTTNIKEILAWVELTHKFIETAQNLKEIKPLEATNKEDALQEMLSEVRLEDQKINKHYVRVQKFIESRAS